MVLHNDMDVGRYQPEQAHMAVVPGSAFGHDGHFRISFATATERLEQACERIQPALYRKPDTSKKHPGHKIHPYLLRELKDRRLGQPAGVVAPGVNQHGQLDFTEGR